MRGSDDQLFCLNDQGGSVMSVTENRTGTLRTEEYGHSPCVCLDMTHACDVIRECGEIVPSLQARMGTGGNQIPLCYVYNLNKVARSTSVLRRLTPLECTRLQGFPDGWVDIGDWVDTKGKKHRRWGTVLLSRSGGGCFSAWRNTSRKRPLSAHFLTA